MISPAYESFVSEICTEAISKEATKQQRAIMQSIDKESGCNAAIRPLYMDLTKAIKKGDTKEAIRIVTDASVALRKFNLLASQKIHDIKKIKGTPGDAIASVTDAFKKDVANHKNSQKVQLFLDAKNVQMFQSTMKIRENLEKNWIPVLLEELRTNGCSDRAFALAASIKSAGEHNKPKA